MLAVTIAFIGFIGDTVSSISEKSSYMHQCNDYQTQVYCFTNDYRVANGLQPLEYSQELVDSSSLKSKSMCENNYFSHDYNGTSWKARLHGFNYSFYGENLAKGYETPSSAVQALIDSPTHKANIVGDYTHLGVYAEYCNGKLYTTQTFAKL